MMAVSPTLTVEALEEELKLLGCTKTEKHTETTCIWRTPNGRHFSVPDPAKMYLVPTETRERLERVVRGLADIRKLDEYDNR